MRKTIDSAGRLVEPGGRVEIELPPAQVHVQTEDGLPRLVADAEMAPLTVRDVRDALEATRR